MEEKRRWVKSEELGAHAWAKRVGVIFAEVVICVVAAALAVANGLQGDPENRVFTCVCTAVFMWVPHLLERLFKHRFSFSQHLAYIVMLTGSAVIGSAFNVFNKVSWYDCLMHGLSGYVMMVFIIIPFGRKLRENEEGGKKSSVFTAALLMLLCSLGTACAWEIMEFAVDVLAGQESQGHVPPEVLAQLEAQGITGVAAAWEGMKYVSVLDTDLDMLCHFGGSLLFCAHYVVHALTGKNLLMGSLIKDISGAEMNAGVRRAGAAEPCFEEPADKRE